MPRRASRGAASPEAAAGRRRLWLVLPLALATVGLGGCVDDETGHQFATDPQPSAELPTSAPSPTAAVDLSPTPLASPFSPPALLVPRGAARWVYFRSDRDLWAMGEAPDQARPILTTPPGTEIRAIAASPSGDRVAVILVEAGDDGETAALLVLTADGSELRRLDQLEGVTGEAAAGSVRSLDWAPQGEHLLIGFEPGGLVALPVAEIGGPNVLVAAGTAADPVDAAWSPTGEEIGFLSDGAEPTNLYLLGVAATPGTPRPVLPAASPERTIDDWAWLPDGRSLIYSEGSGPIASADLWRVGTDGSDRRLVASAGSAAPVARVARVAPSPDGRAVAYTIVVPGDAGPRFHSLWVREITGGRGFQIAVPTDEAVTDLWWTASGLTFRTVPASAFAGSYDGGPFALYRAATGPEPTLIYDSGDDAAGTPAGDGTPTPPATPGPSPAAAGD